MVWVIPVAIGFLLVALLALAVSAYALHRAIEAQIEVRALQNSTHNVQFVPIEPNAAEEAEIEKAMNADEKLAWDALSMTSEPLS